jgi:hypothetical protein
VSCLESRRSVGLSIFLRSLLFLIQHSTNHTCSWGSLHSGLWVWLAELCSCSRKVCGLRKREIWWRSRAAYRITVSLEVSKASTRQSVDRYCASHIRNRSRLGGDTRVSYMVPGWLQSSKQRRGFQQCLQPDRALTEHFQNCGKSFAHFGQQALSRRQ